MTVFDGRPNFAKRHSVYRHRKTFYGRHGKRSLDLTVVFLCAPAWVFLCIPVVMAGLARRRSFFWIEYKIGCFGMPFIAIRFDESGRFGEMVTHLGLAKLPMLWNVAKGEMSIIGSRPKTVAQACAHRAAAYFQLRPGLIEPGETLVAEAEYVVKQGLLYDLFTLCRYCFKA